MPTPSPRDLKEADKALEFLLIKICKHVKTKNKHPRCLCGTIDTSLTRKMFAKALAVREAEVVKGILKVVEDHGEKNGYYVSGSLDSIREYARGRGIDL